MKINIKKGCTVIRDYGTAFLNLWQMQLSASACLDIQSLFDSCKALTCHYHIFAAGSCRVESIHRELKTLLIA